MIESLFVQEATRAEGDWVLGLPRRVGGQVAFPGSHVVDSSYNKLSQAHKRVGFEAAVVEVVLRGGGWSSSHSSSSIRREQNLSCLQVRAISSGRGMFSHSAGGAKTEREAGGTFAQP